MKIVVVPTMFPKYIGDYYGSFVFDEVKRIAKDHEVHVITQHNVHTPYEEIIENVHIHRFKWLEPKKFKALVHFKGVIDNIRLISYLISLFFNLILLVKKNEFDIIHAHSVIPTGFISVIVGKILKKPVVITAHGMDVNNFVEKYFFRHLLSFSLKHCDRVIVVSNDLAENVISLGIDKNKVVLLRNAIDTNKFKHSKDRSLRYNFNIVDEEILILFVGYLDTFKGIFELLDAFKELYGENNKIKLMFVGEGPKEDLLIKKVSEYGLKNSVIFAGKISSDNIPKYYQIADIFVLPSYTEGGGPPLVVLEAMATGVPVIVSDVGGIPEIVNNGFNGLLISPKNSKFLVDVIKLLIYDSELYAKLIKKGYLTIKEKFNINIKIKKLIDLYNLIIDN